MSTVYLVGVFDHAHFPADVVHSSDRPDVQYRINPEYFALPETAQSAGKPISTFDGYRIYRSADIPKAPAEALPVYQTAPGGSMMIPTGAVLVRFAERDDVKSRTPDIAAVGYRVTEVLPYAPNAAWVQAESGSPRDALRLLEKLASLSGMENVAPQFVTERRRR
jgi:hypothetical protein